MRGFPLWLPWRCVFCERLQLCYRIATGQPITHIALRAQTRKGHDLEASDNAHECQGNLLDMLPPWGIVVGEEDDVRITQALGIASTPFPRPHRACSSH